MEAKLNGICRANGYVYAKVDCSEHVKDITVCAPSGELMPCNWCVMPEGDVVVVLPTLEKGALDVALSATSEVVHLKVSMERAKWESRFNYRFNKAIPDQIRGIDDGDSHKRVNFEFVRIMPDGEEKILRALYWGPEDKLRDVRLACFDGCGKLLEVSPVMLGATAKPSDFDPEYIVTTADFSIRLPESAKSCTLAAYDSETSALLGFRTADIGLFEHLIGESIPMLVDASADPAYDGWFRNARVDAGTLAKQRERRFGQALTFSIVVPLYRTPVAFFKQMVESVEAQSFAGWELVLVNASPEDGELKDAVNTACERDKRIHVVELGENLGIAGNTNAGIAVCSGDFVCFLDHDDVLEPDALFEYASALEERPATDLLYCDEDKLTEKGRYEQPYFKPDFDPYLLRCYNYITHFLCVRASVLQEVGCIDSQFDGAQDHDLTLRVTERSSNVFHVRKVLYHWRISETSTAKLDGESKGYADDAGARAVQAHLERQGIAGVIEDTPWQFVHRVKYLVQDDPLVSIIIPNKDCAALLEACVRSVIEKTTYANFEIVIVENNSTSLEIEDCYNALQKYDERVRVVRWAHEFNFSKIVNFGVAQAQGDYLVLLNNDTEVIEPAWLENMLGICQQEEVGIVGARLLYADGTIQHAGVIFPDYWTPAKEAFRDLPDSFSGYFHQGALTHAQSAVTAACFMTRRDVFDAVGGFDEELTVAYNDVDYCLKVREKGLLVIYEPTVKLYHYESVSRGWDGGAPEKRIRSLEEESRLRGRWARYYVLGDPYFSPHLATGWYRLA